MKKRKALIKTAAVLIATTMLGISSVYPSVNILPGSLIQVQAATIVMEGDCGAVEETVTYKLDSDGVLTISGSGEMKIYLTPFDGAPWCGNRNSVKKVVIEEGVTSIGDSAFKGCIGLSSIEIPGIVTSIGYGAFYGCSGLSSIVVEEGNEVYDSRENCNAIIRKENNELIVGCKNTKIPGSVTSIGLNAFYGCSGIGHLRIVAD